MKNYIIADPWNIIENDFNPEYHKISESIFSIGNGRMGQRANFEESYSGESLQGSYVAGVYYPDKTRVGWWKIGYPEYFAKVLNSTNWIGIQVQIDGEELDIAKCEVISFSRVLNMKEGVLERKCRVRMASGKKLQIKSTRFCSIDNDQIGAIKYSIKALNFDGEISFTPYLDADVENEDSNYEEKFWLPVDAQVQNNKGFVVSETKKTEYHVCVGMEFKMIKDGEFIDSGYVEECRELYVSSKIETEIKEEEEITLFKYAAILSSMNHSKEDLMSECKSVLDDAVNRGFEKLLNDQRNAWANKWDEADVIIEGDDAAQQGIRFNIFQLYQTYTGEDERLNIGPKGFTGEKYGGSTYWDTEAYCFPFYLSTADQKVAKQLLVYRYRQLGKAIENAEKLGFKDGAALFPMVTMTGEECHNEWEITFEEIHRNGAIAYAVFDYIRYTNDKSYLIEYGTELLIAISRFWAQRVHFSSRRDQYVMHGVTGPNEYENNVNNNWHTNYMAKWCLEYTIESIEYFKKENAVKWEELKEKIKFYPNTEMNEWKRIVEKMYLPYDEELGIFVQHDGFLDKAWEKTIDDLKPADKPINQNWSWDRILRSVYIKQADVLQSLYFFEDQFSEEELLRNFKFYEPRTVHESSLSPCVHAVLAAKLRLKEKAYEMYLRTARLDLDDYNNDTEDGCHITSMAGSWMAIVKGFGGLRIKNNKLYLAPYLPEKWSSYSFKIRWRDYLLNIKVGKDGIEVENTSKRSLNLSLFDESFKIDSNSTLNYYEG